MSILEIQQELRKLANPDIASHSQRFFKTGKGEYGEGDHFLGIRVPVLRRHARVFRDIPLRDTITLLKSDFHEERQCALFILVDKFKRGSLEQKQHIFDSYLAHTAHINGWDLVDCSAHLIVGPYLFERNRDILYSLVKSESLWERRISILATFHFIRAQQFADTLKLSELLLQDSQDLIHKAVGWMLREVGNRNLPAEEAFLKRHYSIMPRTMLRYAIEKFPKDKRKAYLQGKV